MYIRYEGVGNWNVGVRAAFAPLYYPDTLVYIRTPK